jgi:hypothetical protein
MAANPSGAHQAGELSLAKHRYASSGGVRACRHNGMNAGTPAPQLQLFEWTVAPVEQRSVAEFPFIIKATRLEQQLESQSVTVAAQENGPLPSEAGQARQLIPLKPNLFVATGASFPRLPGTVGPPPAETGP